MRPRLGDGQAIKRDFVIRLDPLNALVLNLWADARRELHSASFATLGESQRTRFIRVYSAMLLAAPGDGLAPDYLRVLKKDQPNVAGVEPKRPVVLTGDRAKRAEAVRAVVRAIAERAKANTGADALRGDALTAELFRVAADAALKADAAEGEGDDESEGESVEAADAATTAAVNASIESGDATALLFNDHLQAAWDGRQPDFATVAALHTAMAFHLDVMAYRATNS
jgi:hypothetical protein